MMFLYQSFDNGFKVLGVIPGITKRCDKGRHDKFLS